MKRLLRAGLSLRIINLISCGSMTHVSDIKLIRTYTTLDHRQKAEKGMTYAQSFFHYLYPFPLPLLLSPFLCGIAESFGFIPFEQKL